MYTTLTTGWYSCPIDIGLCHVTCFAAREMQVEAILPAQISRHFHHYAFFPLSNLPISAPSVTLRPRLGLCSVPLASLVLMPHLLDHGSGTQDSRIFCPDKQPQSTSRPFARLVHTNMDHTAGVHSPRLTGPGTRAQTHGPGGHMWARRAFTAPASAAWGSGKDKRAGLSLHCDVSVWSSKKSRNSEFYLGLLGCYERILVEEDRTYLK